jgi:hypothetical protein
MNKHTGIAITNKIMEKGYSFAIGIIYDLCKKLFDLLLNITMHIIAIIKYAKNKEQISKK